MGRRLLPKKEKKGPTAQYISRHAAQKKLQLSLADFRKLCILKGIFPRDPKRKPKGVTDQIFYHSKDIQFLTHEPLIQKLQELRVFNRKVKKALARREKSVARVLERRRPVYTLYHIVRERYPALTDALGDADDALCTIALFASLPADDEKHVKAEMIADASRLLDEFLALAAEKRFLRKVFCSIKGYYFQLSCLGRDILFLVPHQFPQQLPLDVDFRVLGSFLEFYNCFLQSINFKLYKLNGLNYPPSCDAEMVRGACRFLALSLPESGVTSATDHGNSDNQSLILHGGSTRTDSSQVDASACCNSTASPTNRDDPSMESTAAPSDVGTRDNGDKDDRDDQSESIQATLTQMQHEFPGDECLSRLTAEVTRETASPVQTLFADLQFFISREVPLLPFAFMARSCGAQSVGWQGEHSPVDMMDESITHHIIDRPIPASLESLKYRREFVQPQWVLDSINKQQLLPTGAYAVGRQLPPHLSPFVDNHETPVTSLAGAAQPSEEVTDDQYGTWTLPPDNPDSEAAEDDGGPEDDGELGDADEAVRVALEKERSVHESLRREKRKRVGGHQQRSDSDPAEGSRKRRQDAVDKKEARLRKKQIEEKERKLVMMPKRRRKLYERLTGTARNKRV